MAAEAPALLHVVGYLTGASLYAMLLAMVVMTRMCALRASQPHSFTMESIRVRIVLEGIAKLISSVVAPNDTIPTTSPRMSRSGPPEFPVAMTPSNWMRLAQFWQGVASSTPAGMGLRRVMMPVLAHNLPESIGLLAAASATFATRCVEGIEANSERIRELLERNAVIVTALNPHIGYDNGARIVKEAAATGRSVRELVLESGLMSADELDAALDLKKMTEGGIT